MGSIRLQQSPPKAAPEHLVQIGAGDGEHSVLVIDRRDQRVQWLCQGWAVDEMLMNAQRAVNALSDRNLVRSPNTGYHFDMFLMNLKMLSQRKLTIVGCMTSYATVPCSTWDSPAVEVVCSD